MRSCRNCTLSDLKRHVGSKHKGVSYPCSEFNYAATQKGDLRKHFENKHVGVRHPCS